MELDLEGRGFSPLERHFARFIAKLSGDARQEVALAAALVSRSTGEGNICLDLKAYARRPVSDVGDPCPSFDAWLDILRKNKAVGRPGDYQPLIMDEKGRLYLYRYWDYERKLSEFILEKAKNQGGTPWPGETRSRLQDRLNLLFPREAAAGPDWQKLAALISLRKPFTVISGSPGTGKTTTVTKIMALLLELAAPQRLSIALTAPTGKAAVRLQEAVKKTKALLPCTEAVREAIPERAVTLHRLLGNLPRSSDFRHHRENPLTFDVVIVDEASMVDLSLLAKLVDALPAKAKLILLGDKDQLTSVEAGAVLGDICGAASPDVFSGPCIAEVELLTGESWAGALLPGGSDLQSCLVQLKKNYRFGAASGLGQVSAAVNRGDGAAVLSLLKAEAFGDVRWQAPQGAGFLAALKSRVVEGCRPYLQALTRGEPGEIFALFEGFRILCALRQGPWGVGAINALAERLLAEAGLIAPRGRWYSGRPIMITKNDYRQRLFNGDVGIVMPDPAAGGELRVFFRDAAGEIRTFLPLRLPEHETVYAMTVHKSQGSEFDRVLLILPDRDVPLLTRELIYTGLTRARHDLEIWCPESILRAAVDRRITRASGLAEALWGGGERR